MQTSPGALDAVQHARRFLTDAEATNNHVAQSEAGYLQSAFDLVRVWCNMQSL